MPIGRLVLAAGLSLAACQGHPSSRGDSLVPLAEIIRTSPFADPGLRESSGVAVSRRHPGVLWTHNDSGDDAWLYATDTLGHALGRVRLTGAASRDWEDIALGPCEAGYCIYVADTGDNTGSRPEVQLYRLPEPDLPTRGESVTGDFHSLRVTYPGGPDDVEAILVDSAGAVHLITKGRSGRIMHLRLTPAAWEQNQPVMAEDLGVLPVLPDPRTGRLVTAAALAPDGHRVAVRTYREVYLGELDHRGRLVLAGTPACDIAAAGQGGEAIDWLGDAAGTLVLTTERSWGQGGSVTLVRCPPIPPDS